jgi:hypothetical protein
VSATQAAFDTVIADIVFVVGHPFVLMLLGVIAHFLTKMGDPAVAQRCLWDYWRANPLQTGLAFIGATVGYVLFVHQPDFERMNDGIKDIIRISAFGIGFTCDRIADSVGAAAKRRVDAKLAEQEQVPMQKPVPPQPPS